MATRKHALFRACTPGHVNARASCYIYGTTSPGIDTGVTIVGEGVLFLSRTAVIEMAEVLGLSFTAEGRQLEEENAYLAQEALLLKERVKGLESDLRVIGKAVKAATI